ncbi:MAG: UDP-glucose/GDP-mannose dehydrogenase family protein [Legionella sp.]|uniref:UDP-glucose dehydrogenase family protein n=1 Tax=Legionella sp. TaxID=459 RepID=UPI00283FF179|nr:UDP-glucose/GDP-mannose dehydrogenase family protein [Legionella sp.]
MRIVVVGSGYVGLVSGACFADFGHSVVCVDNNEVKIKDLQDGYKLPIYEPGLASIIKHNVKLKRLFFSTHLEHEVSQADAVFIAVGTPSRKLDGHADLSQVYTVAKTIAGALKGYTVIVDKSTVPVGTGDEVERIIREINPTADFSVVSNPEFLREGEAIDDFKRADRVVVGVEDERAKEVMHRIYDLNKYLPPVYFVNRRTAELIKYASNAFLATKITFINEMADLCEKVGGNVQELAVGMGLDSRIGPKFLNAGPGYGGSCFPKDTKALIKTGQEYGARLNIVETVVNVNDIRKRDMTKKIINACGGNVRGKTIALLGLAFKPNTDDMRDSPAIDIVTALEDNGAHVRAFDPESMSQAKEILPNVEYCGDVYSAASCADALVLVTEWNIFKNIEWVYLKEILNELVFVDLRNVYNKNKIEAYGFEYHGVG